MTDFNTTATRLVERGYSVIPIIPNEAADVIADKMREGGAKGYLHLTCTSISCHPDTHSAPSRG